MSLFLLMSLLCIAANEDSAEKQQATCSDCHEVQAAELATSVHAAAGVDCRTCHGGEKEYAVAPSVVRASRQGATQPEDSEAHPPASPFEHGAEFRGKPSRQAIPERCGTCHSDVAMMNPYGLPTDQLARYRISGHGRALYQNNDDRVAVCTDCHGTHAVLGSKAPASPVYPTNVPETCARCHSDPTIMADSQLSTTVVEEYRESVHGRALLEGGDLSMPNCAVCHGSHSAVPPGYRDVGHICGRCHPQEEQFFLKSHHARFPLFPRCVGCHAATVDRRDHRITRVAASPEELRNTYRQVRADLPASAVTSESFCETFAERREPRREPLVDYCRRCHSISQQAAHRAFFGELDERARHIGDELNDCIRDAEIRYGTTAERVEQVGRGVLLVQDEAMRVEEMRTKLVSLGPLLHALDPKTFKASTVELHALADEVNQSLDDKLQHLRWRYWTLVPMWAFVIVFASALWRKYKQLKAEMVKPWLR